MSQDCANVDDSIITDLIKAGMGNTIDDSFELVHRHVTDGTLDVGKEHQIDLSRKYFFTVDRIIDYVDIYDREFSDPLVAVAKKLYQKIDNYVTNVIKDNADNYGIDLINVQDGLVTFKFVSKHKWMDKAIDAIKGGDIQVTINNDTLVIDGDGKYVPDCRVEVAKKPVAGADYQVTIVGKAPRDGKVTFFASTDADFLTEVMSKLSMFFKKDED